MDIELHEEFENITIKYGSCYLSFDLSCYELLDLVQNVRTQFPAVNKCKLNELFTKLEGMIKDYGTNHPE